MADNVIQMLPPIPERLQCKCGSVWWNAKVCVIGVKVTDYGLPLVCVECGEKGHP